MGERRLLRDRDRLIESFKNIANDVLFENYQNLLTIANDKFNQAIVTDKNEVKSIIAPIEKRLELFDKKITEVEKVGQEIQREAHSLSKALSSSHTSGQWGEMHLRRTVEISGMMPYCDFLEQKQCENSKKRPDMVIKLPGNRCIIVDSKVPIDTYTKAISNEDETHMEDYISCLKKHIKDLGQKSYWKEFDYNTPEFVLMFLPVESFFSVAIRKDPTLIEYGIKEKVIIATPCSLIAILRAISFAWQQETVAKNAREIGETGREVVIILGKLIQRLQEFGRGLRKNIESYDEIDSFIGRKVMPIANKLKNFGIEVNEGKIDAIDELHE
jgi:DNA recombination protein RmuC